MRNPLPLADPEEMTETELDHLPVPDDLRRALAGDYADRARVVAGQRVRVDLDWWNTSLVKLGAPGGCLWVDGADTGQVDVTRAHVFAAADQGVWPLLWLSMAWGTGSRRRLVHRRMRAAAADPERYAAALTAAARAAAADPERAYALLYPGDRSLVPTLGPSFFTKFLYFAGGGNPVHRSRILDSRVARSLHRAGWRSLRTGGAWPARTYGRYTGLLDAWTRTLSAELGHQVAADTVERWLFDQGVSSAA